MNAIIKGTRAALITSALALVAWPSRAGWAQGVVSPQVPGSATSDATQSGAVTTAVVVGSLLAVLVVLGALIKMLDLKRKREGEAVVVQARISDAVLRDPRLFSLPITPTAGPCWIRPRSWTPPGHPIPAAKPRARPDGESRREDLRTEPGRRPRRSPACRSTAARARSA